MQVGKASENDTITTITTTDDFQNSELKNLDIETKTTMTQLRIKSKYNSMMASDKRVPSVFSKVRIRVLPACRLISPSVSFLTVVGLVGLFVIFIGRRIFHESSVA